MLKPYAYWLAMIAFYGVYMLLFYRVSSEINLFENVYFCGVCIFRFSLIYVNYVKYWLLHQILKD